MLIVWAPEGRTLWKQSRSTTGPPLFTKYGSDLLLLAVRTNKPRRFSGPVSASPEDQFKAWHLRQPVIGWCGLFKSTILCSTIGYHIAFIADAGLDLMRPGQLVHM